MFPRDGHPAAGETPHFIRLQPAVNRDRSDIPQENYL